MKCLREFHSEGCIDKHNPGKLVLSDFNHYGEIINQTAFDGASEAPLVGRLLAGDDDCLPNTRGIVRDRAHAIRTNLNNLLASDDELSRINWQLMEKEKSLAKLLQYYPRAKTFTWHARGLC